MSSKPNFSNKKTDENLLPQTMVFNAVVNKTSRPADSFGVKFRLHES